MTSFAMPSRQVLGMQTPSASWEQLFEMLRACHAQMHRMLALLARLEVHVAVHGADATAAQAAVDVMRYFYQAAFLHQLDEEEQQVFPAALARGLAEVQAAVAQLQQDHTAMEAAWAALRLVLAAWANPAASPSCAHRTAAHPCQCVGGANTTRRTSHFRSRLYTPWFRPGKWSPWGVQWAHVVALSSDLSGSNRFVVCI